MKYVVYSLDGNNQRKKTVYHNMKPLVSQGQFNNRVSVVLAFVEDTIECWVVQVDVLHGDGIDELKRYYNDLYCWLPQLTRISLHDYSHLDD